MLTKGQFSAVLLWLGIPLVVFMILFLLNPTYEGRLFQKTDGTYGINILIGLEAVNALLLCGGLWVINQTSDQQRARPNVSSRLLLLLTFILLTLPALWIVVLYPSLVILMTSGAL